MCVWMCTCVCVPWVNTEWPSCNTLLPMDPCDERSTHKPKDENVKLFGNNLADYFHSHQGLILLLWRHLYSQVSDRTHTVTPFSWIDNINPVWCQPEVNSAICYVKRLDINNLNTRSQRSAEELSKKYGRIVICVLKLHKVITWPIHCCSIGPILTLLWIYQAVSGVQSLETVCKTYNDISFIHSNKHVKL